MVCELSKVLGFDFFLSDELRPFLRVVNHLRDEVEGLVINFVVVDVLVSFEFPTQSKSFSFFLFHVRRQLGVFKVDV